MFKSKKYFELFKDDYKIINGVTVYRIKALIDFDNIKAGELGGYIEKEDNLKVYYSVLDPGWYSYYAENNNVRASWIYDNACVYGDSVVYLGGRVKGNSVICNSHILDDSTVDGDCSIFNSKVSYKSTIVGDSFISNSELENVTIEDFTSLYTVQMKKSTVEGCTSIQDSEILKSRIIDSTINNIKTIRDTIISRSFIVSTDGNISLTKVPYIVNGYITSNNSFSTFVTPEEPISGFTVYTDTDGGYLITSSEQTYTLNGFYNLIKNKIYFERTIKVLEGVPINGTYLSELVWRAIESV